MEARASEDVAWFRLNHEIIDGAGPLAMVLGPADWTHGIARPFQNVVADPNPNLNVQLFRRPVAHRPWVIDRVRRVRVADVEGVAEGVIQFRKDRLVGRGRMGGVRRRAAPPLH